MSSDHTPVSRPFLQRFMDSFLQDRNITWMLMVGMLILLGSSLLLVSAHWDTYTPVWKYVIFLAYTAATFGFGQWTRYRLVLPRTATVLQVLTVLLVPITFIVLHWVQRQESGALGHGFNWILGGLNLLFAVYAARSIFHHFLRGHQLTFLTSYLLLGMAGAVVPGLPESWAPGVVLILWGIFAVGSVKVNRHVFWLTEEHRLPRTCGFLRILLLGSQFLMVFALHAPQAFGLEWLGLGAILVAVPVLLTADAVAWVFQKRTGDLIRPLPWTTIAPLVIGLVLCAGGLVLAGTSVLPPNRPYALVLASGLSALLMAVVGRRTGKEAFVWAMLGGVLLAYNFSPAFFIDAAHALIAKGTRVVHEEKLPYAFYGLTYLPLLLAVMVGGWICMLRGAKLFARPLCIFAIGLACVMLAVSFGHVKALVPVALVMTFVFALQVGLFRDGRLAGLAVISWIIAAGWFAAFADRVFEWSLPANAEVVFLALAAFTLLLAGFPLDGLVARLLPRGSVGNSFIAKLWQAPCQNASLILSFCLTGYWLSTQAILPMDKDVWPYALSLTALLFVEAWHWWRQPAIRYPALLLINWQLISLTVLLFAPPFRALLELQYENCAPLCLPLAVVAAASLLGWQAWKRPRSSPWLEVVSVHLGALRLLAVVAICGTVKLQPELTAGDVGLAAAAFLMAFLGELCSACRRQSEERVWVAIGVALAAVGYFAFFHVIPLGRGIAMFTVLGLGFLLWLIGEGVRQWHPLTILRRPLQQLAIVLPLATVSLGVYRHLFDEPVWLGANSLALLLAAGFYFWRGLEWRSKPVVILSGLILNVALVLLWRELAWDDPQFFMIPVGISILALVQLLKAEIPGRFHDPLRYLGALVILISPTFHIVGGSWLHLLSLMVVSVGVMLVAMGLRVRALIYTGTAFLVADLVAMVVRGSIDDPNVLWIAGLAVGAGVIALGAVCERNRETLVARIHVLTETLKQWN